MTSPPAWTLDAACTPHVAAGNDPWHPDDEAPPREQRALYEEARQICVGCPVQVECTRAGLVLLNTGYVDGMYGGLTPDEMRALARYLGRSPRKIAQHGSRSRYVNYGCRCDPCRAANAAGESARRAGLKDARTWAA